MWLSLHRGVRTRVQEIVVVVVFGMAVSIRSNPASLSAQRKLASTSLELSRTYERLASGMRINRASDDAAGLAVASTLNAERRVLGAALRNISDGISITSVMSGALDSQSSILGRLSELAEQSANGTLSAAQRATMQSEYSTLVKEMGRIGDTTQFNGLELMRGDRGNVRGGIQFQVGIRGDANSRLGMNGLDLGTGSGVIDLNSLSISMAGVNLLVHGGTEAELREQIGNRVIFTEGSQSSDGQKKAVVLFRSNVDNTVGVFALEYDSATGRYAGDFITYLDAISFQNVGGGQIGYDGATGRVTSVNALFYSVNGNDFALDLDFYGYLFQSNPQGGHTALNFTGIESMGGARLALDAIRNKIAELGAYRGVLGATESRLNTALSLVAQARDTRALAASRITDIDVGAESSELVRKQILQQASAAVLAQANQAPALALQLLN